MASSASPATSRRFLALWFPWLPADRLANHGAAPADAPFAFIEKDRGALRLAAVDPQAARLGLAPGLTLADARARVPELVAIDQDPAADLRWLERIADICDRFTPMVALDAHDALTLDISGVAHLFGDETGLAGDLLDRLSFATVHHACAASPEAAQALARFGQGRVGKDERSAVRRLPVAALRLEEEAETALRRAGLKTIGDVVDCPSAALAARFGSDATALLARLTGRSDSRIVPRRVLPALVFERRFAEPIARTDVVLHSLAELSAEAAEALAERNGGGRRFAARLYRSDGQIRDLAVETGLPTRDPALVQRLFAERIETLADPLDPGFGFDLIRLAVPKIDPLAPTQLALEGGTARVPAGEPLAAVIDRLGTRLGRGRIRRFVPKETHIPEQAMLALPAVEAAPLHWAALDPGEPPTRPIHMFDPPQPITVLAEVPDGPPKRFRWQRNQHEVMRSEGPERIAAEWWHTGAAGDLTRDYYRVEDVRGRRFWIFRNGLYGAETMAPGWYVHGLFA